MSRYSLDWYGTLTRLDSTGEHCTNLYKVNIDGTEYFATINSNYTINLGPPVSPKQEMVETKGQSIVYINGKRILLDPCVLSYEQIVAKAFENRGRYDKSYPYTVTYRVSRQDISGGGSVTTQGSLGIGPNNTIFINVADTSGA